MKHQHLQPRMRPVVDIHQHHILLVHQLPSIIDALLVLITHLQNFGDELSSGTGTC